MTDIDLGDDYHFRAAQRALRIGQLLDGFGDHAAETEARKRILYTSDEEFARLMGRSAVQLDESASVPQSSLRFDEGQLPAHQ